jgi:hypothetical protein
MKNVSMLQIENPLGSSKQKIQHTLKNHLVSQGKKLNNPRDQKEFLF